jgi:hypothetical protein
MVVFPEQHIRMLADFYQGHGSEGVVISGVQNNWPGVNNAHLCMVFQS